MVNELVLLTGPHFAPMEILNCLAQERGYKVEYNPQQHGIPLKQGATDDKYALLILILYLSWLIRWLIAFQLLNIHLSIVRFALIYQLTKPVVKKAVTSSSIPDTTAKLPVQDDKPSEEASGTG